MKAYMLRNKRTGEFYERRGGWVPKEKGAIWPTKAGPNAAKGHGAYTNLEDLEVVTLTLVEERDVALVFAQDAEALYVNGVKVMQDTTLYGAEVLKALDILYWCFNADEQWLSSIQGQLPEKFADIKRAEDKIEYECWGAGRGN